MGVQLQKILLVWLMLQVCVYGDYTIVTRIHSYTNPTNTGQNRSSANCCDNHRESDDTCRTEGKCDNRFTFCLKAFGDTSNETNGCVGDVLKSEINHNDVAIKFTVPSWLGLDNPLRLNGLSTAWQGAQVYVEVTDMDIYGGLYYQLVDRWRLNREPTVFTAGASFSTPTVYNGIFGFGFLELSFRVECAEFYYGTFCENLNECLSQSIHCNRGNCVDGEGFATCSCDPGYTGGRCEVDIDECAAVNCSGNGVCVDGVNSFSCYCASGFTGEVCNVKEQESSVDAAVVAGGVIGGVVVILVVIVLTAIITAAITAVVVKSKTVTTESFQQNEVSDKCIGVEPQLMYDYVDPASITGQSDGIEMKPNEDEAEDFEMKTNNVYGVHL